MQETNCPESNRVEYCFEYASLPSFFEFRNFLVEFHCYIILILFESKRDKKHFSLFSPTDLYIAIL